MATKNLTAGQKAAATKEANKAVAAKASPAILAGKAKPVIKAGQKANPAVEAEHTDENGGASRHDLADSIRDTLKEAGFGMSPKLAVATVKAFETSVTNFIRQGREVHMPGFGKFRLSHRAAGERRNPATGDMVHVEASVVPAFKVGRALKLAANKLDASEGAAE